MLSERAELVLAGGALSSSRLIELVCNMPGVPAAVANELAAALLGPSPRFRQAANGEWSLGDEGFEATISLVSKRSRLDSLSFLVVDVETTGLSPRLGGRITEIAAYAVEGGEITPVLDTLVHPGRPIPPYITALTGISWSMVMNCARFEKHSDTVLNALAGRVFVGHNVAFDWGFVSSELLRATGISPAVSRLCTVKLARALLPLLPRRSLDHVAFHLGIEIESRHRAAGDALATAKVLKQLLRIASEAGVTTWAEMEKLLGARGRKPRRPRRRGRTNAHPIP